MEQTKKETVIPSSSKKFEISYADIAKKNPEATKESSKEEEQPLLKKVKLPKKKNNKKQEHTDTKVVEKVSNTKTLDKEVNQKKKNTTEKEPVEPAKEIITVPKQEEIKKKVKEETKEKKDKETIQSITSSITPKSTNIDNETYASKVKRLAEERRQSTNNTEENDLHSVEPDYGEMVVLVKNLPNNVSEKQLINLFSSFGEVEQFSFPPRQSKTKQGYITFKNAQDAHNFSKEIVSLGDKTLKFSLITVEKREKYMNQTTISSPSTLESNPNSIEVEQQKKRPEHDGKHRNKTNTKSSYRPQRQHTHQVNKLKLYVGNLPKSISEHKDLIALFPKFTVVKANVVAEDSKEYNYGFVEFESEEEAAEAKREMHQKKIAPELPPLQVDYSKENKHRYKNFNNNKRNTQASAIHNRSNPYLNNYNQITTPLTEPFSLEQHQYHQQKQLSYIQEDFNPDEGEGSPQVSGQNNSNIGEVKPELYQNDNSGGNTDYTSALSYPEIYTNQSYLKDTNQNQPYQYSPSTPGQYPYSPNMHSHHPMNNFPNIPQFYRMMFQSQGSYIDHTKKDSDKKMDQFNPYAPNVSHGSDMYHHQMMQMRNNQQSPHQHPLQQVHPQHPSPVHDVMQMGYHPQYIPYQNQAVFRGNSQQIPPNTMGYSGMNYSVGYSQMPISPGNMMKNRYNRNRRPSYKKKHRNSDRHSMSQDVTNLFVFHLPSDMKEETLRSLFGKYGTIESVKIIRDPTSGQSKGYGFVKFENMDNAKEAVSKLNGHKIAKKHLKVQFKSSRRMQNAKQSVDKRTENSNGVENEPEDQEFKTGDDILDSEYGGDIEEVEYQEELDIGDIKILGRGNGQPEANKQIIQEQTQVFQQPSPNKEEQEQIQPLLQHEQQLEASQSNEQ